MNIEVTIPAMLGPSVGGRRTIHVDAATLAGAIEEVRTQFPLLRGHVWDDQGKLRRHVLIFYNDTATRWLPTLEVPLRPGDRLAIVQSTSGG